MTRLPQPGGDSGNWGEILNDFLLKEHAADGTHLPSAFPDAASTTKGKIRLAGDLAGTADAPTVPGLADKETPAGAQAKVDAHSSDTTNVHGIADTSQLAVRQSGSLTVLNRLLDRHYLTSAGYYENVPLTATKVFTVPANTVCLATPNAYNGGVGSATLQLYWLDPSQSAGPPVLADRWVSMTMTTGTMSNPAVDAIIPEGWSLWAISSATGVNLAPRLILIDAPLPGGSWTHHAIKGVPITDTAMHTVTTPGNWANRVNSATLHNTTGSSIIFYASIKRAIDVAPFIVFTVTVPANSQAATGFQSQIREGDTMYIRATATGLNYFMSYNERPIVGI